MSGTGEGTPEFAEMAPAAVESARTATEISSNPPSNPDVPPKALSESYTDQIEKNMDAHRRMRWWAFGVVGVISSAYLLSLLYVLLHFFDGRLIAAVLGAINWTTPNWHVLVMITLAMGVFAAIPLTLAMALVRMITDKESEPESMLKTPTLELAKVFADLVKYAAKNGSH